MKRLVDILKKIALTSSRPIKRLFGDQFFEDLRPEFLWLETTDACGNQCTFCDIWENKATRHPLTPAEIETVLGDPLFQGLRVVVVSGGEPTLRKDLAEILSAVHRAAPRAYVVLSSSAMLPDRLLSAVRSALDEGMDLEVGISVDGLAARHDQARGVAGLFDKVDRTLRELAELKRLHARLRVKIGFVLSDATVDQMDAVSDYAAALGFEFNVQWYNQAAYYGNVGRDLLSDTAQLERATRSLRPTPLRTWGRRVLRGKPLDYNCSTLHNSCLLKCNGDVVPCFNYWDQTAGNVRQETPSSLWKSERARQARRVVRACHGCLNSCGVQWSFEANYIARARFYLRHPGLLLEKLGWSRARGGARARRPGEREAGPATQPQLIPLERLRTHHR